MTPSPETLVGWLLENQDQVLSDSENTSSLDGIRPQDTGQEQAATAMSEDTDDSLSDEYSVDPPFTTSLQQISGMQEGV